MPLTISTALEVTKRNQIENSLVHTCMYILCICADESHEFDEVFLLWNEWVDTILIFAAWQCYACSNRKKT